MRILSREPGIYDTLPVCWENIKDGVKLKVHSKEWFDENCEKSVRGSYILDVTSCPEDPMANAEATQDYFVEKMFRFFGKTVTVETEYAYGNKRLVLHADKEHGIDEDCNDYNWYPEMFECVVQ